MDGAARSIALEGSSHRRADRAHRLSHADRRRPGDALGRAHRPRARAGPSVRAQLALAWRTRVGNDAGDVGGGADGGRAVGCRPEARRLGGGGSRGDRSGRPSRSLAGVPGRAPGTPLWGGVTGALRRYARSFSGFERDARIFLLVTLVYGVTLSLWWVDFNLYLASLHFDTAFIGLVLTAGSAAGAVVAFPASLLSDRIGRRLVLVFATGASALGVLGLLLVGSSPAVVLCAALIGAAVSYTHLRAHETRHDL